MICEEKKTWTYENGSIIKNESMKYENMIISYHNFFKLNFEKIKQNKSNMTID